MAETMAINNGWGAMCRTMYWQYIGISGYWNIVIVLSVVDTVFRKHWNAIKLFFVSSTIHYKNGF